MKKYVLVIAVCLIAFVAQIQAVPRDKVIVEIATGTW
jgi:hypothetical protein